ncbi:MAG: hypothetical protein ACRYG7_33780 [Janthinobacterium lividum]
MLPTSSSLSFVRRGLPSLLLIAAGITLAILFRDSSAWPADTKQLVYPLAQVLGVGGCMLFGSFVQQRPLHTMKQELASAAVIVLVLVLTKQY